MWRWEWIKLRNRVWRIEAAMRGIYLLIYSFVIESCCFVTKFPWLNINGHWKESLKIGISLREKGRDTCVPLPNSYGNFYGSIREKVLARADSTTSERVYPRVSKLYWEKIYFPVTATTYPDAFAFPRPSIQFLIVCEMASHRRRGDRESFRVFVD